MQEEYIRISKTAIQKRIEELEKYLPLDREEEAFKLGRLKELNKIIYQSLPLLPEIEKAFLAGREIGEQYHDTEYTYTESVQQYLKQLKLDI